LQKNISVNSYMTLDPMANLGKPHYFYYIDGKPTVTLRFAGEPHHQYYREVGSKLLPVRGVTTVLKIIDKSHYLMPWATKVMGQELLRTIPVYAKGEIINCTIPLFEELIHKAKSAHRRIKEAAGDVGHAAHKYLEDVINYALQNSYGVVEWGFFRFTKEEDPRVVSCCKAAFSWMSQHKVKWVKTESKIYSQVYNYAGTMDGLCYVNSCTDPVCCPTPFSSDLCVADWKSSNQLSLQYLYQTAAYQAAETEEKGTEIGSRWILRLGKEDGDFEAWHATNFDQDFNGFLAALRLDEIHEAVEKRMNEEKKARTVRKKTKKKLNKEMELE